MGWTVQRFVWTLMTPEVTTHVAAVGKECVWRDIRTAPLTVQSVHLLKDAVSYCWASGSEPSYWASADFIR